MGMQPPQRIPWVWPYNPRGASLAKSPRRVNVMLEKAGERVFAQKRPGISALYEYGAGTGLGLTFYNGNLYTVLSVAGVDTLKVTGTTNSGADGSAWTSSGTAPWVARQLFQTVNCNGTIYVLGGITTGGTVLGDVWSITVGQDWKLCTAAAPWAGRYGFMSGVIGNTIYVIGGKDGSGTILADVWSTTDGVTWTQTTAAMATGTVAFGNAISADNGIYVLGGTDNSSTLLDLVTFSTDGVTWKLVNDAPGWAARNNAAVWYYQNALWIGGGEDAAGTTTLNDVWTSTNGGKTWTQKSAAAFVTGLSRAGFIVYADKMWLVNGWTGSAGSNRVYSSTDGATWTVVTTSGPFAASSGGALIVFATLTAISAYHYQTMYWMGGVETTGVTANNNVYYANLNVTLTVSSAIPSVPTAGQRFQFNSFVEGTKLLLKNQSGLWVFDGGKLIKVTDDGYPLETVPGIVVLGGFAYVMDPTGLIRNCNIDDPYHWPMLNAVAADYEDDTGVALVKYLNYVVAFGTYTTQFFYDAGIAVGSPLQPYLSGNMAIGCADANSVVRIGQTVAWVTRTREFWRQVAIFDGLKPRFISTWAVEKSIANWPDVSAFAVYCTGHMFYVMWTVNQPAWCYDFSSGEWTEWTDTVSVDRAFAMVDATSTLMVVGNLLLHPTNGTVYLVDLSVLDDDGTPFPVMLITDKVDNANNRNKFWGQFEVIGDMNPGTPEISFSDDDFQTYGPARTVNMADQRPVLYQNGDGRRRIFKYLQTDSNPIRVEAIEQSWEQGGP